MPQATAWAHTLAFGVVAAAAIATLASVSYGRPPSGPGSAPGEVRVCSDPCASSKCFAVLEEHLQYLGYACSSNSSPEIASRTNALQEGLQHLKRISSGKPPDCQ